MGVDVAAVFNGRLSLIFCANDHTREPAKNPADLKKGSAEKQQLLLFFRQNVLCLDKAARTVRRRSDSLAVL